MANDRDTGWPGAGDAAALHLHRRGGAHGGCSGTGPTHRPDPAGDRVRRRTDRDDAGCGGDMTDFDPAQHRMVTEQRWFEDFRLGERFVLPSRTMTEAVF